MPQTPRPNKQLSAAAPMSLGPIRVPHSGRASHHQHRKLHSNETDSFHPRGRSTGRFARNGLRPNLGENIAVTRDEIYTGNDKVARHHHQFAGDFHYDHSVESRRHLDGRRAETN